MKIKKLISLLIPIAMVLALMPTIQFAVNAAITNPNDSSDYKVDVRAEVGAANVEAVAGIRFFVTHPNGAWAGFNGQLSYNSPTTGYTNLSWGGPDETGKDVILTGTDTVEWYSTSALFDSTDGYVEFFLKSWGGDITVDGYEFLTTTGAVYGSDPGDPGDPGTEPGEDIGSEVIYTQLYVDDAESTSAFISTADLVDGTDYVLEFNLTSIGHTSYRVRYAEGTEWEFADDDDFVGSDSADGTASAAAAFIPALFHNETNYGDNKTFKANFTYGDFPVGAIINGATVNYIAIIGYKGESRFVINSVKITEKVSGDVVLSWTNPAPLKAEGFDPIQPKPTNPTFENFVNGTKDNDGYLRVSGNPTLTVENGKGLKVSGRNNNWDTVDFLFGNIPDGWYNFEASLESNVNTTFALGVADFSYGEISNSVIEDVKTATLTFNNIQLLDGKLWLDVHYMDDSTDLTRQNRIRLQSLDANVDFYIKSIKLTDSSGAVVVEYKTPAANVPSTNITGDEKGAISEVTVSGDYVDVSKLEVELKSAPDGAIDEAKLTEAIKTADAGKKADKTVVVEINVKSDGTPVTDLGGTYLNIKIKATELGFTTGDSVTVFNYHGGSLKLIGTYTVDADGFITIKVSEFSPFAFVKLIDDETTSGPSGTPSAPSTPAKPAGTVNDESGEQAKTEPESNDTTTVLKKEPRVTDDKDLNDDSDMEEDGDFGDNGVADGNDAIGIIDSADPNRTMNPKTGVVIAIPALLIAGGTAIVARRKK